MADILLVTDASWVVNDVRAALSEPRFSITVIDDPRTVTASLAESNIEVLIVDFQIGSMGGMATTREVRDAAATSNMHRPAVILLLDRDADAFLAGRSGADGWVRKPFSAPALRSVIDDVMAGVSDTS